ncbi:MAG: AAA family ATPase [Spirochaetes bacterium]|nr:MAG: AAA family ATPase [Spirochaetota bacterium]
MAEQLIVKNLEFIKVLPYWAQDLSYKYCSKTTNLYIVHGNIRDFLPNKMYEGEFIFVRIQEFISEVLFGNRDIIAYYDRSSGINFCTPEMQKEYLSAMKKAFPDKRMEDFLSRNPFEAFDLMEKYFLMNIPNKLRIVLIIDYAETLIPNTEINQMGEEDRYCQVTLNRWAHDPIFTQGDVSIILLTENLTDINQRLVRSPSTVKVNIPYPDEKVRQSFLEFLERKEELFLESHLTPQRMARVTSGLNLMNLNQMAAETFQEDKPISMDYLKIKKKEMIENEAAGLIEFVETEHDLSLVSGHDFVKKRFRSAAKAIKQGRLDVLPMGYLVSGPIGTGKSFMVTAFAGEIGIPMVKFRNLRSKWHGVTESNLERALTILKAMSPVGVMIDEADTFLGSRHEEGDSGTSNRLFAQIASFMGNTEYRGKIIWFLLTCRPDLIPIDLKRQGRAEEHLSLFYPDTAAEKEDLFKILVKKLKIKIQDFSISDLLKKYHFQSSGADLEAILIRAKFKAAMENHVILTKKDVEETIKDFVPPAYPHEIELQNLVAVLECTSKEMIPKRFQNFERTKVINQIRELKTLLGEIE